MKAGYHHGDLRRAILDAAVEAIGSSGVDGWSMRELARRAGVSHAAPAHHFRDKAGLFTALAAEAFDLLADELEGSGDDFLETGLAYVAFAVAHPVHFEVMFQRTLYRPDDPAVQEAEQRAATVLARGAHLAAAGDPDQRSVALAGWSIAHGFASLWLGGALDFPADADPVAQARPVLSRLLPE
ncbi:MAG: TetR/AcrR family transcriptional regulator [Pseudorhodobacter sp.]|nr:TetR/AcrR family transcriptional regulator [Pseudorhodobacter sp.]